MKFRPLSSESIRIEAGITDRRHNFLFPNRTYRVETVFIHPFYNVDSRNSPHDLALLQICRPFDFGAKDLTAPISVDDSDALKWTSLSVAGWGQVRVAL